MPVYFSVAREFDFPEKKDLSVVGNSSPKTKFNLFSCVISTIT